MEVNGGGLLYPTCLQNDGLSVIFSNVLTFYKNLFQAMYQLTCFFGRKIVSILSFTAGDFKMLQIFCRF